MQFDLLDHLKFVVLVNNFLNGAANTSASVTTTETEARSKTSGSEGGTRTVGTHGAIGTSWTVSSSLTDHGVPAITAGMVDGSSTGRRHHTFHSNSTHERQLTDHIQDTLVSVVRHYGDTDGSEGGGAGDRQSATTGRAELHGGGVDSIVTQASASVASAQSVDSQTSACQASAGVGEAIVCPSRSTQAARTGKSRDISNRCAAGALSECGLKNSKD